MTRMLAGLAALVLSTAAAGAGPATPPYRLNLTGRTLADAAVVLERDYHVKTAIARPSSTRGDKAVEGDTLWEMVDAMLREYHADGYLFGDALAVNEMPALEGTASPPDRRATGGAVLALLRQRWQRIKPAALPTGVECVVIPAALDAEEIAAVRDYVRGEAERARASIKASPRLAQEEMSWLRLADGTLLLETQTSFGIARRSLGATPREGSAADSSAWQTLLSRPIGRPFGEMRLGTTVDLEGRSTLGSLAARVARAVAADITVDPAVADVPVAVAARGIPAAEALDLLAVACGIRWDPHRDVLHYRVAPAPTRRLRVRERWAVLSFGRARPAWAGQVWPLLTPEQRGDLERGQKVRITSLGRSPRRWLDFAIAVEAAGRFASAEGDLTRAETCPMDSTLAAYADGVVLGRVHVRVGGMTKLLCWTVAPEDAKGRSHGTGPGLGHSTERSGSYDNWYLTDRYSPNHTHAVRSRAYGGAALRGSWGAPPPWAGKEGDYQP